MGAFSTGRYLGGVQCCGWRDDEMTQAPEKLGQGSNQASRDRTAGCFPTLRAITKLGVRLECLYHRAKQALNRSEGPPVGQFCKGGKSGSPGENLGPSSPLEPLEVHGSSCPMKARTSTVLETLGNHLSHQEVSARLRSCPTCLPGQLRGLNASTDQREGAGC